MPFSALNIQGKRGLYVLSEPRPEFTRSRTAPDELEETWNADYEDDLREGQVHPHRPGMIIDRISGREDVPAVISGSSRRPGVYILNVSSLGSLDGLRPTKILGETSRRTLESGFDERTLRYLSWHAKWKACKGLSSTNTIYCDAHGFTDGRAFYFARKNGGSGITAQSISSLGVAYHVVNAKANEFQISLTAGGAVHALGSDITSCDVIAAEFAHGAPHPDHPNLFLCELNGSSENTDWRTVDAVYRGLEQDKPYHRLISVNGQQFSSSEPIAVDLPGGWEEPLNSNFTLPEIVVTDTYTVASGTLPTADIPSFETPPNAPSIASYVISADDDQLVHNYPYGWTLVSAPHQATLNSQISAMVYSRVYRYIWPVMFK